MEDINRLAYRVNAETHGEMMRFALSFLYWKIRVIRKIQCNLGWALGFRNELSAYYFPNPPILERPIRPHPYGNVTVEMILPTDEAEHLDQLVQEFGFPTRSHLAREAFQLLEWFTKEGVDNEVLVLSAMDDASTQEIIYVYPSEEPEKPNDQEAADPVSTGAMTPDNHEVSATGPAPTEGEEATHGEQ